MGSRQDNWPGGRHEGISVESVLRGLEARISILRKRFWVEIFVLRLVGSWELMMAVLRGFAWQGGRSGGIVVKCNRKDLGRVPGEPGKEPADIIAERSAGIF